MSHSVRLAALALVGALLPLLAAADEPTEADPLPLRRVLIPPARVAAELERARQGILVKLPRAEFEARVRQAARTGEPAENVPRLVRAAYTARLKETALVGGGDWTIVNPTAGSAVLPLPDFNLALSKITLDDPTALTVLGDLDGKTLGLLATRTGKQSVFFDWSLQGSQAGPELHFDLQVPASPIASLELTVPADRTVAVSRGVALISGPHETAEKDQREWRLQFAGRTRVEFVVRPLGAAGRLPPLLLAQLTTTQQLAPQSLQARYEFQVEALHGGVRKLTFDYDPPLEPYDVTTDRAELQGWSLDRKNRTLTVQLGESEESLRLTVLCEAPLFQDKKDRVWISPGIRLREAAAHSETLLLQANADVRLENWSAGLFRLIKSGVAPDGGQLLTLVDGGAPARYAERPSAALKVHGADVSARQRTWWQVGPGGSTLTVEVTYEVASGTLMKLPLRTTAEWANPPWEVEEVRLEPKGLLGPWSPTLSKGMLVVELQQALTAGERATLTVKLRSPRERVVPGSDSLLPLPFPDLEPLNVRLREGMLAIDVDPRYQASVLKASHELTPPEKGGPWGDVLPNYAYLFKGKSVTGQLRLTLHRPRASARSSTEVSLAPDRGTLFVRLQLEPAVGSPTSVDVELSAPTAGLAKWRSEGAPNLIREAQRQVHIETAQRVLALGPWNPPEIAALLAAAPVREHWHLTFARPLTQRETIILEAALPAPLGAAGEARGERRWDVPLLTVRGADRMEGEVALHLLGLDLLRADAEAVQESNRNTAPAGGGRNAVPSRQESWRFFRYGRALFPGRLPALRVSGKVLGADAALRLDRSPREVCDRSRLTTYVEPRGRLLHHYRFRLWNWRQTTLPVLLPPGMKLLAAKAEGRWLDHLEQRLTPEGRTEVSLPVASGTAPHRFELVYAADDVWPSWAPWARLTAPVPELPVLPTSFYRTWRLPPGVTPLTASVRRLPDPLGPHDPESWWAPVRHAWRAGHPWLTTVAPELFP
ncbi:MAG TPA: hypothetical protein VEL76_14970, partial [Gemmataceae bacterium]|nr:hypothetical protein [Gemmataceae bacterium]